MDRSTYERQYLEFVRRSADVGAQLAAPGAELYPCLEDDTSLTGHSFGGATVVCSTPFPKIPAGAA